MSSSTTKKVPFPSQNQRNGWRTALHRDFSRPNSDSIFRPKFSEMRHLMSTDNSGLGDSEMKNFGGGSRDRYFITTSTSSTFQKNTAPRGSGLVPYPRSAQPFASYRNRDLSQAPTRRKKLSICFRASRRQKKTISKHRIPLARVLESYSRSKSIQSQDTSAIVRLCDVEFQHLCYRTRCLFPEKKNVCRLE